MLSSAHRMQPQMPRFMVVIQRAATARNLGSPWSPLLPNQHKGACPLLKASITRCFHVMEPTSVVEYFFGMQRCHCAYCHQDDSSTSNGMWAHRMSVHDYQDLIDRGWRRSGLYCYKPIMKRTCCPSYAIKCDTTEIRLSKTQKKVLKRFNRFLNNDSEQAASSSESSEEDEKTVATIRSTPTVVTAPEQRVGSAQRPVSGARPATTEKANKRRTERRLQKLISQGMSQEDAVAAMKAKALQKNREKFLEELIAGEPVSHPTHQLEIKLVRLQPASTEFEETFHTAHALYKKYQLTVHHENEAQCTEEQFRSFLCESPLEIEESTSGVKYGSFHQQYWLDGILIMVGVIDILPKSVSSVYLFYDPDYSHLSLGVYSALREIAFTRSLYAPSPDLKFYYMGYYIHSCQKMHYKSQYRPSYLLCPESYRWHPFDSCLPKLERSKYCRFEEDIYIAADDDFSISDLEQALVKKFDEVMTFKELRQIAYASPLILEEFASVVGKRCFYRMAVTAESLIPTAQSSACYY